MTDATGLIQVLNQVTPVDLYRDVVPPGATSVYAQIRLSGKIVATVYTSGVAATSGTDPRIENLPSLRNPRGSGLVLAHRRAEDIGRAVGGTVVLADSAPTLVPRPQPPAQRYVDYVAVARDRAQLRSRGATI